MSEPEVNEQSGADNSHANADQPKMSAGAQLAAYREERGWSIEQVASQLNLAPRQIAAIERDDYPALPGMPIIRGFIRAYAKLLKVDSAPLLSGLGGETVLTHDSIAPRKSLSTPFAENRLPSMLDRPGLSSKWVLGGLLVVLLGVAIWAARHDTDISGMSKSASSQVKDGAANITNPPQANTSGSESSVIPPVVPADVPEPMPATSSPSPSAVVPSPAPEVPVISGKDTLQFKVGEDSWIEVRRSGNNAVVLSRVVKAGEAESVEVTEPVSVVIGNASGVAATLRGVPVELKVNTSNNVARLSLK